MRATYIQNQKEVIRAKTCSTRDNVTSNNNGVYSSDVTLLPSSLRDKFTWNKFTKAVRWFVYNWTFVLLFSSTGCSLTVVQHVDLNSGWLVMELDLFQYESFEVRFPSSGISGSFLEFSCTPLPTCMYGFNLLKWTTRYFHGWFVRCTLKVTSLMTFTTLKGPCQGQCSLHDCCLEVAGKWTHKRVLLNLSIIPSDVWVLLYLKFGITLWSVLIQNHLDLCVRFLGLGIKWWIHLSLFITQLGFHILHWVHFGPFSEIVSNK